MIWRKNGDNFYLSCNPAQQRITMPKKVAIIDSVFSIEGIGTVIAMPMEGEWALDRQEKFIVESAFRSGHKVAFVFRHSLKTFK
jgi:hypothetical protein